LPVTDEIHEPVTKRRSWLDQHGPAALHAGPLETESQQGSACALRMLKPIRLKTTRQPAFFAGCELMLHR
jgi:hypothetical protein